MLSFLYRLARTFHREHGYKPNVVVMSRQHFRQLQQSLPVFADSTDLARQIGMDIILSEDCLHPHVAWLPQVRRAAG